jgi:hypothetical protein
VPAKRKCFSALTTARRIVQQVRDENDHPTLAERVGQLMERLRDIGFAAQAQSFERNEQRSQVSAARARPHHRPHGDVERGEADGVALLIHQVGERRREALAVLVLVRPAFAPP